MKEFKKFLIDATHNQLDWLNKPDVFTMSFEGLIGDMGSEKQIEVILQLCDFLSIQTERTTVERVLKESIGQPTQTWSGKRTEIDSFWNDEVESFFCNEGGAQINARLGYKV